MMNVYVIQKGNLDIIPNSTNWNKEYCLNLIYLDSSHDLARRFAEVKPDVILTVQASEQNLPELYKQPLFYRQRWLDEPEKSRYTVHAIHECYRTALKKQTGPIVSMFTPAYKSMERIKRALRSLQHQTLCEWEWVIVDDSPDEDTWRSFLVPLAKEEPRMRIWRTYKNDGDIGSVKHAAASMCRGKYLVEFDHDDELRPEALSLIVAAFEKNDNVGMIGSDCIELWEETLEDWNYGDFYGFGFHSYYKQWLDNRWVSVARNGPLNQWTIRHIIGVLNHVRVWRRTCYEEIGRHDWRLNVADDYDLIVRTFLSSKWRIAKLPRLLYLQYRALGGSNFTVQRNKFIQISTGFVQQNHESDIQKRLIELKMPDELARRPWHKPPKPAFEINFCHDLSADLTLDPCPDRVSVVMPTHGAHRQLLKRALKSLKRQTFPNWVVYVIGDCSLDLEKLMKDKTWLQEPRVHWWNLSESRKSGCYMRNYALKTLVTSDYVTYLDDDNWLLPNHLETLYTALTKQKSKDGRDPTWAFSSFQVEEKGIVTQKRVLVQRPVLYRLDTSCVMHHRSLLQKHNRYWRPEKIKDASGAEVTLAGYAVDWDLFKIWAQANEPWVATKRYTLIYNNVNQDMDSIIAKYDDQQLSDEEGDNDSIKKRNNKSGDGSHELHVFDIKDTTPKHRPTSLDQKQDKNTTTATPNLRVVELCSASDHILTTQQESVDSLFELIGRPVGCTISIYDLDTHMTVTDVAIDDNGNASSDLKLDTELSTLVFDNTKEPRDESVVVDVKSIELSNTKPVAKLQLFLEDVEERQEKDDIARFLHA